MHHIRVILYYGLYRFTILQRMGGVCRVRLESVKNWGHYRANIFIFLTNGNLGLWRDLKVNS